MNIHNPEVEAEGELFPPPTRSTVFITVQGRNGQLRHYTLPPEVIAPPSNVLINGALFALEGTWTVPEKAGDPIHAHYAPASPSWALDISAVQWSQAAPDMPKKEAA